MPTKPSSILSQTTPTAAEEGANEVIISMSTSEYVSRWITEDGALRDAAQLQPYSAKVRPWVHQLEARNLLIYASAIIVER